MSEIKLFNKYSYSDVAVGDPGLVRYINLHPVMVPKTGARYAGNRFHKTDKCNIVERLAHKLMGSGHRGKKHVISSGQNAGKGFGTVEIVEDAFEIIAQRTKENPLAVFVKAVENAAPREEIIAIEYGGARYPRAVEVAPQRRVDLVLRQMSQACYNGSFQKKKSAAQVLADEIMHAYNLSNQSTAVSKKLELERQADSAR